MGSETREPELITDKRNRYHLIWQDGWGKRWPRRTGLIRRVRNDDGQETFSHHESTRTEDSFRVTDAFYDEPFPHHAEAGTGQTPGADFSEPLPYDGRTDEWDYSCAVETGAFHNLVVSVVPPAIIERDEYRYLLHDLHDWGAQITPAADDLKATEKDLGSFSGLPDYDGKSFILIGQPGTGKTMFLVWLLLHLLEHRQPVAWQSAQGVYHIFRPEGVYTGFASNPIGSDLLNGVWALVDESPYITLPARALRKSARVLVYACLPKQVRWEELEKQAQAWSIVTEVPHIFEAAAAGHECHPPSGLDTSVEMYRRFGPSLRTINRIQAAAARGKRSNTSEAQAHKVRASARALARDPDLLRAVERLDVPSSIDSDLVVIRPLRHHRPDGNFCPAICWVDIPTDYLRGVLSEAVQAHRGCQMLDLLLLLGPRLTLRDYAGWRFETKMHRRFVTGGNPISLMDGTPAIKSAKTVVFGTVATLKDLSPSESTYWYPPTQDFPGIHAIFANFGDLYVLQAATDAGEPVSPLEGLLKVRNALGPALTDRFDWYFVVVTRKWPGSESLAWLESELAGFVVGRAGEPVAVRAAILR